MSDTMAKPRQARGKLKIGDDWNAITIIALSQSSPLKAIVRGVASTGISRSRGNSMKVQARSPACAIRP